MDERRYRRLKEAALLSLRASRLDEAIKTADALLEVHPDDPELHQIRGMAFSRSEKLEEAFVALRKAVELDPKSPRHAYNLAVQLYATSQNGEAEKFAEQAKQSGHPEAAALLRAIRGEAPLAVRDVHVLPWLKDREAAWFATGTVLFGLDCVVAALFLYRFPAAPVGEVLQNSRYRDVALLSDPVSQLTVFLAIVGMITTFLWVLVDLVDGRRKLVWLVPMVVLGFFGWNALPMGLYLFFGRKLKYAMDAKA